MSELHVSLAIVGGGLAGSLLAFRMASLEPNLPMLLIERDSSLGGNHTWSFHGSDVSPEARAWLSPLLEREWPGYATRFTDSHRKITLPYASLRSATFDAKVREAIGSRARLRSAVRRISPDGRIELENGNHLTADCVIDARGSASASAYRGRTAYQKFLGLEVHLRGEHGLREPLLMDADCDQTSGYRFFYVLPWDAKTLLIEETFYNESPELDREALRASVLAYASRQGWEVAAIAREEVGVLPIPLDRWPKAEADAPLRIGAAGGYFHPTTGYSLPETLRQIAAIESVPAATRSHATIRGALDRYEADLRSRQAYFLLLNRMLFLGAQPAHRARIFSRFYGMPASLIARFYAGKLRASDQVRLLVGRPPIPVGRALRIGWDSWRNETSGGGA